MIPLFNVAVQEEDFDIATLQAGLLQGSAAEGAIATFTGYVRSDNEDRQVHSLELEHYPGMTERSVMQILQESTQRWPVLCAHVVHRVGKLSPGEQIVWVGVSSSHRGASFAACEFIMDYLKTRAPFWKKELGPLGEHWVDARESDNERASRWQAES
ncbi:MAG: molybdopterin synthase catalytic subunit MoaE [Halioglobus sp.]